MSDELKIHKFFFVQEKITWIKEQVTVKLRNWVRSC